MFILVIADNKSLVGTVYESWEDHADLASSLNCQQSSEVEESQELLAVLQNCGRQLAVAVDNLRGLSFSICSGKQR